MKTVCVIADTHRKHRGVEIPPCDILIHCGDFCTFRKEDQETLEDVDDWFSSLDVEHILCIAGNHDFPLERREFYFSHARYLEDEEWEIDGLRFYGTPWCPDLMGFAFYGNEAELQTRWKAIPTGVDVLITHTPPHGYLDLPTSRTVNLGCPLLREELDRIRPRVHAFGHVHASFGNQQTEETLFINAALVKGSNLELTNPPTVFTLE